MQDYSTLGVTSMDDRRKLFQLIQSIKAQYVDTPEAAASASSASSTPQQRNSISQEDSTMDPSAAPTGFPRGYNTSGGSTSSAVQSITDLAKSAAEARLSIGRRSGSAMVNGLHHSKSMSTSMAAAYQQQEQLQQQQQQQQQYGGGYY